MYGRVGGHSSAKWEAEHVFLLLSPFLLPRPLPASGGLVAKASESTQVLSEHLLWHLTRRGMSPKDIHGPIPGTHKHYFIWQTRTLQI